MLGLPLPTSVVALVTGGRKENRRNLCETGIEDKCLKNGEWKSRLLRKVKTGNIWKIRR
jgi:hypothetical protein